MRGKRAQTSPSRTSSFYHRIITDCIGFFNTPQDKTFVPGKFFCKLAVDIFYFKVYILRRYDEAMDQLVKVTQIFAEAAAKNGQQVCIEPLRTEECNIINTAEDSIKLAKDTGCANVGGHVDYYHLMQNGEKMSKLEGLAKDIVHAHIASPCKRTAPTADDGADYKQFFDYLRKGGYDATVSFEGKADRTPEALTALCTFLKTL